MVMGPWAEYLIVSGVQRNSLGRAGPEGGLERWTRKRPMRCTDNAMVSYRAEAESPRARATWRSGRQIHIEAEAEGPSCSS